MQLVQFSVSSCRFIYHLPIYFLVFLMVLLTSVSIYVRSLTSPFLNTREFVNVRVVNFCFPVLAREQFVNSSGHFFPRRFFFITFDLDGSFATNVNISFLFLSPLLSLLPLISISMNLCMIFRRVRKTAKSGYNLRRVCPSVWNNSAPTGRIFVKFYIWVFFWEYVENIQVSLKSDKNNGYFAWWPAYVCDSMSLNSS
jgi:uncharacterized membrane protein YhaH (DUF805 family)